MKNFHVPLPDRTYAQLREEAERTHVPVTILASDAIELWLRHRLRKVRYESIAVYAEETAVTNFDFDPDLESAGIEHLVRTGKKRNRDRDRRRSASACLD